MNRSEWRSHLTALRTALITCVGLLSLSTAPAWAVAGTVTEFPVKSSPLGITAGPDGALWFTESAAAIGRITTSGVIKEFHINTTNSEPTAITTGPDGNLWFTEGGTNKIGYISSGK
jgi:virginiamycin B lyase